MQNNVYHAFPDFNSTKLFQKISNVQSYYVYAVKHVFKQRSVKNEKQYKLNLSRIKNAHFLNVSQIVEPMFNASRLITVGRFV